MKWPIYCDDICPLCERFDLNFVPARPKKADELFDQPAEFHCSDADCDFVELVKNPRVITDEGGYQIAIYGEVSQLAYHEGSRETRRDDSPG